MSTDVLHEFSRKRSKGKGIQGRIWWKKGRLYPRGAHAGDRREHRTAGRGEGPCRQSRSVCALSRQDSIPREMRYFLTISATLKVMASSNSRRSSPVNFLIFSSR